MNNMINRVLAIVLLFALVCTNTFSAWAETLDEQNAQDELANPKPIENITVYIKNTDEFIDFAKKCSLDTYSKNKTFVLKSDINLQDVDFQPIPLFSGVFDGNRHTIEGFSITDNVSTAGLFCIVLEGAVVKNLYVKGHVEPMGEQKMLGGIVGLNDGRIEDCTFDGTVMGENSIGGIVGINNGLINRCRMQGNLSGGQCTGGIAGQNIGDIKYSSNLASINVTAKNDEVSFTDVENTLLDPKLTEDASTSVIDTGGISGYSEGNLIKCTNNGDIGYEHIGYNVGGVTGRSVGYIEDCKNYGTIKGRKDVGGIAGQMEPMLFLEYMENNLERMKEELDTLNYLIDNTISSTAESMDAINERLDKSLEYVVDTQNATVDLAEELGDWINSMSKVLSEGDWDISSGVTPDIPQLGSEYEESLAEIESSLNALDKQLGALNGEVNAANNELETNMKKINNQQSVVNDLALQIVSDSQQMVTDIQDRDVAVFYSDISEESLFASDETSFLSDEGHIIYCTNEGRIYADLNAGGIVGTIAIDSDLDPEDDITKNGENSPEFQYHSMAVVRDCTNNSYVTAKKNCAGGIAGRMDLGILYLCEGYGAVKSESGGYVGGVIGYSTSIVKKCYAKCNIEGIRYVGGIVGSGDTVENCYAMVKIDSYTQYAGAISGDFNGTFSQNYFAQTANEQGVDRFSYSDKAQPITYNELIKVADIPEQFKQFKLKFVDGDTVVDTITFNYGDTISKDDIPNIQSNSSSYGKWSKTEYKNLMFDETIELISNDFIQELASEQTRSDGRHVLLVDGQFEGDSQLLLKKKDRNDAGIDDCVEHWQISFSSDGSDVHTVRYLTVSEDRSDIKIYILKDGSWKKTTTQIMGSYYLFELEGNNANIAVVEKSGLSWLFYCLILSVVAIIAVILIILRKRFII